MPRYLTPVLLTVLVMPVLAGPAWAEFTPEQAKSARALIEKFKDEQFKVREDAVNALVEMGPDVIKMVRETVKESRDAEVKLRCQMVIARLGKKYFIGPDDKVIDLEATPKVTLSVKDAKLEDVLKEICRQTGNRMPKIQTQQAGAEKVTLELKDVNFWEALDAVEGATGVVYTRDHQTQWLIFQTVPAEGDVERPGACCGPVTVKVTHVSSNRQRYFRQPHTRANQHYMNIGLQCFWETRLPVLSGVPVVTRAVTDDGTELNVPDNRHARRYGIFGHNPGAHSISFSQIPTDVARSVDLEGVIRLELGTGPKEIRLEDIFAPAKKDEGDDKDAEGEDRQIRTDPLKMTLGDPVRNEGNVQVPVEGSGKWGCPPLRGPSTLYGLFLVDPDGRRIRGQMQLRSARSGNNEFNFQGNWVFQTTTKKGKYSLIYVYPERTITKEYPFTLRNVPLP